MRNTVQKTMILKTVRSMMDHPTADEVYGKVISSCPGISKGTVYRNLNLLAQEGEILRVSIANAPDRYDFTTVNHAHCICSRCGKVFDYRLKRMPQLNDSDNKGFKAEDMNIIVHGICHECQMKESEEKEKS